MSKRILVGQIGAAHGIRGEARVKSFTEPPEAIAGYGTLSSEDGTLSLTIERFRPADTVLIVKFREVPDRNRAEALNGTRLFLDRSALPEPEEEEFYHADLIGLRAEGADGTVYGTVVQIQDFGAGDLLEIDPGEGRATVFLPFTRAFVPVVAPSEGRVVIEPPAGLFGGGAGEEDDRDRDADGGEGR